MTSSSYSDYQEIKYKFDSPYLNETIFPEEDRPTILTGPLLHQIPIDLESPFLNGIEPNKYTIDSSNDELEIFKDETIGEYIDEDTGDILLEEFWGDQETEFQTEIEWENFQNFEHINHDDAHSQIELLQESQESPICVQDMVNNYPVQEYEKDEEVEFEVYEYFKKSKRCPFCLKELVETELGGFCTACSGEVAEIDADSETHAYFKHELRDSALASALEYNRKRAKLIGWHTYYDDIVSTVLKLNYSPDEESFALEIARWQDSNGLDDDGKLGPSTWKKMQDVLGILSKSNPKNGPLSIIDTRIPDPIGNKYRLRNHSRKYGRQFGISQTVAALLWIVEKWYEQYPGILIAFGDISYKGGGEIQPHKSHRLGLDVDLALFDRATNKRISRMNVSKKYQPIVGAFINLVVSNPILKVKTIFYFDHQLSTKIKNSKSSLLHKRHIHIRFCRPPELKGALDRNKVSTTAKYDCIGQSELNEDTSQWSDNYIDSFEQELFEEELSSSALISAVEYNRKYSKILDWYHHYDAIVSKILKLSYSPNEEAFAQALAKWQNKNGLTDDGKIGPATWRNIRVILGLSWDSKPKVASASRKENIAKIIEANRGVFGISQANEKMAAKVWGNNRLRAISASNIYKYIGSFAEFSTHVEFSRTLFAKTSLAHYTTGNDINFVKAIATREGGIRGLIRTDNTKVSSAGKDTHSAGVSGLDYLYKRQKYFREAGIFIEPVPQSALVPGRENRAPAYIMAKHLMFAHMVEIGRREYNTWHKDLVKVMKHKGFTENPNVLFNNLGRNARRAWVALSYSGGGRVRAVFDYLISDQEKRGLALDFNDILNNPLLSLKQKYKARVILARATSLRAHVFDQFL